ncbi:MAG: hypothetical protein KAX05_08845 [Bacteroidales bacterium]|nr:hypothetical protein [Bacteroidales bacterium]
MGKKSKKINSAWWFLGIMSVIYLGLLLFLPDLFKQSFLFFFKLLIKLIPVLFGVYLIMFFINWLLKPQKIIRYLGYKSGFKGILIAITGGIISTGPIYVWFSLLADLRNMGMTNFLITIFLYNRAIKIPLLTLIIYYFGLQFTITLTVLLIIFSILNGWLVDKLLQTVCVKRK